MQKKKTLDIQREVEDFFKDEEEISLKKVQKENNDNKEQEKNDNKEQEKENINKMLQTIEKNKKIPKDILKKIYNKVYINLVIAMIIMIYLFFIIIGQKNIAKNIYEIDLRIFTGLLFGLTVFLMESAYRKKNKDITIHSVECLVLSTCNLFFIYFNTAFFDKYKLIIGIISISFGIYYIIKSIITFYVMRNNYLNTMSDIYEILNSDYDKEDV